MKSLIGKILQALREPENIILFVGVMVAAILAYSSIRKNDIQQTLAAMLSILGSLAVAQILTNYQTVKRDKQIEEAFSLLKRIETSSKPPLQKRDNLQPLPKRAQSAKDILIIGRSLVVVLRNTDFFVERLLNGATIRLALVDPNNKAVREAMASLLETTIEGFVSDVRSSLQLIDNIRQAAKGSENLQVRFINFVPTLSLVAVDDNLPNGHIVVELLPYKATPALRPHLVFRADENSFGFATFTISLRIFGEMRRQPMIRRTPNNCSK